MMSNDAKIRTQALFCALIIYIFLRNSDPFIWISSCVLLFFFFLNQMQSNEKQEGVIMTQWAL